MNLVMIGRFKEKADASEALKILEKMEERIRAMDSGEIRPDRYNNTALQLLIEMNISTVGSGELEQFQFDVRLDQKGRELVLTTQESEISAYLKVMIEKGAKVEVFSRHDYPEADSDKRKDEEAD